MKEHGSKKRINQIDEIIDTSYKEQLWGFDEWIKRIQENIQGFEKTFPESDRRHHPQYHNYELDKEMLNDHIRGKKSLERKIRWIKGKYAIISWFKGFRFIR